MTIRLAERGIECRIIAGEVLVIEDASAVEGGELVRLEPELRPSAQYSSTLVEAYSSFQRPAVSALT